MASFFDVARTFVQNVRSDSGTVFDPQGNQPYNWYWYGFVESEDGGAFDLQTDPKGVNPPDPFIPPPGTASIGFTTGANGAPFCGSVSGATQFIGITDCSGFAAYVVEQASPEAYQDYVAYKDQLRDAIFDLQQLDRRHTQPWPSAADWAYAGYPERDLPALPGSWQLVANGNTLSEQLDAANIQPGDLLTYGLSDASSPDTGHIVVIGSVASAGEGMWTFTVMDASGPHANDTRTAPGIGSGTIAFQLTDYGWTFNLRPDLTAIGSGNWYPANVIAVLRLVG